MVIPVEYWPLEFFSCRSFVTVIDNRNGGFPRNKRVDMPRLANGGCIFLFFYKVSPH